MSHEAAHAPLDLTDPHHDMHHSHVIIAPRTLVAVLLVLLVFTVLTVAASRGEVWIAETFHVVVPQWVNVGGVLLIALIKGSLVALYFMQLRYDSLLNSIIFLFCLFALVLFLFFSMIDLGQRDTVYTWKSGEIQRGGMGINTRPDVKLPPEQITAAYPMRVDTGTTPIVKFYRDKRLEQIAAKGVADPAAQYLKEENLFAHHGHASEEPTASTPNRSIPRTGLTPDLYKPATPHTEGEHE